MRLRHAFPRTHQSRHGIGLVYTTIVLSVLLGFSSLAIDFGRVQLAKTELQQAVDAAARYAVQGIKDSTYLSKAQSIISDNTCDGTPIALTSADVRVGNWDETATPPFSTSRTPYNAVEVTARRAASRGNAVQLIFGRAIGMNQIDLQAVSTAIFTDAVAAFAGLNAVTVKNNAYIASYNSRRTGNPTQQTAKSNGGIGSNGPIAGFNNNEIRGILHLGPGGSVSGFSVSGNTIRESEPLSAPTVPAWAPVANPGGISQNYTVNSNTQLPGGTYWFSSLTVNKPLSFSGAATLNINGNVLLDSSLTAYDSKPANLHLNQIGTGRTFTDDKNNMDITAVIRAPGSSFTAKNSFVARGDFKFNSIDVKNNFEFYYDEALGYTTDAPGAMTVSVVK